MSSPRWTRIPTLSGGHDDVGVRQQLEDPAADGRDRVDDGSRRIDCCSVPDHALGEHGIGDIAEGDSAPLDRREDGRAAHQRLLRLGWSKNRDSSRAAVAETPSHALRFWSKLPLSCDKGRSAGYERGSQRGRGTTEIGTENPRLRAVAAARQEPDAADRSSAGGGHPAAARPGRPAGPDQGTGHRTVLPGHECRGRRTVHQPGDAVRRRCGDRFRPQGRRLHRAGRRRRLPGDAGRLQDDVAGGACRTARQGGRPGPDQLQRVRRNRRRPHHRLAVRPVPHHHVAALPRLLRRPPVRSDRGVGGDAGRRLRDELLLSDLRRRTDRPGQVHRRRRGRWVHSSTASPTGC